MILPINMHPKLCLYYIGAVVLKELKEHSYPNIMELYIKIASQQQKDPYKISLSSFILSLDWLFLIDEIIIADNGEIKSVSKTINNIN